MSSESFMAEPDGPFSRSLVDPQTLTALRDGAWGKAPLRWHCRDTGLAHALMRALTTQGFLDAALTGDRWGPVQVANTNGTVDATQIESHPPTVAHLQSLYRQGYSVILNDLQQRSLPCAMLCQALTQQLGCGVNANAYLTPADSQALPRHYDDEDVIIFQVDGLKHWQVWLPGEPHNPPIPGLPYSERQALGGAEVLNADLGPGDCLYLPAGFAHQATCTGEPSLHLTFSLAAWCLADVLIPLMRQRLLQTDTGAFLRRRLPLSCLSSNPQESASRLLPDVRTGFFLMGHRLSQTELQATLSSLTEARGQELHCLPPAQTRVNSPFNTDGPITTLTFAD